jgi:hypothetical protein
MGHLPAKYRFALFAAIARAPSIGAAIEICMAAPLTDLTF